MAKFYDDEPVDLDCGHTAEAGDKYLEYSTNLFRGGKKKEVSFTCCDKEECIAECLFNFLDKYFDCEEKKLLDGKSKFEDYSDVAYDRWKDDNL